MSENKFIQRIDVLDMLISILREHEAKLDELVTRLEAVSNAAHGHASDTRLRGEAGLHDEATPP